MATAPSGAYADVISQEKVQELCPEEFEAFLVACREDDEVSEEAEREEDSYYLQYVAKQYLMFDTHDGCPPKIEAAWQALRERFERKTRPRRSEANPNPTGLTLFIGYHDSENCGGGYDGVDGVFFEVDGMYELSPAGRKCQRFVERKHYVQWG